MELEKQLESIDLKDTDKQTFLNEIRKKISIIRYSLEAKDDKIKTLKQNLTSVLVKQKKMKETVQKLEKEIRERDQIYKERQDYFKNQLISVQKDMAEKDELIEGFKEQLNLLEAKIKSYTGKTESKPTPTEIIMLNKEIERLKEVITKKNDTILELENKIRNLIKIDEQDKEIIIKIALKLGKFLPNIKFEQAFEFIKDNTYLDEKSLEIKIKDFREHLVSRR
ncbi:MAG: coiled-coil domain-containing protein [Candidatus Helarchaeota archaeon]